MVNPLPYNYSSLTVTSKYLIVIHVQIAEKHYITCWTIRNHFKKLLV